jgi:hypothetical protein
MARFLIPTAPAEPVRPYLDGVAKSLVERLWGADGPAWGTTLSSIEDVIRSVRHVLAEKMLDEALQRQAGTVAGRPGAFRACPKCGGEPEPGPEGEPRIVATTVGEAEWAEPGTYCRKCRRSFFPPVQEPGHRPHGDQPGLAGQDREVGHDGRVVRPKQRRPGERPLAGD